ncbi:XRE family transcriptional regulator [Bacillus infantis]|uniref:helix-turn-helix transcriptional regulator n=1 Tax=Bacillus infantis TaxID=324767 RepID=UPI00101B86A7|nr:helix-turn-helix transcriptional regulator [Bacillus infantis]RYI30535.1 XRE family transcriptional regulator [Bacillus infantis]
MKRFKVKGCRIKQLLHKNYKTQRQIAEDLGYSVTFINDKANFRTALRLDHAQTFAKYLKCNIEDLYEWEEEGD